jgi:hypothetical protein
MAVPSRSNFLILISKKTATKFDSRILIHLITTIPLGIIIFGSQIPFFMSGTASGKQAAQLGSARSS